MANKLIGLLLAALSLALLALCLAVALGFLEALAIPDTVSAIESAFGLLVLFSLLLAASWKTFAAAKKRLKQS